jgi:SAM-dependent methyltransferase
MTVSASDRPPALDAERAIQLGHPSYVWRAGQERRLEMVRQYVSLEDQVILDIGCGIGMYTDAFGRYSLEVYGVEVELERAAQAAARTAGVAQAVGETLPFPDDVFDLVFSHEVLEHVADDRQVACEAVRVTAPWGHVVAFAPNRLWPWETHGICWGGRYRYGNIPLVNYLPDPLRRRIAWHVRAYTRRSLRALFADLPVVVCAHHTVYPGFDNLVARAPAAGRAARALTYQLEHWPVGRWLGISHLIVLQKTPLP